MSSVSQDLFPVCSQRSIGASSLEKKQGVVQSATFVCRIRTIDGKGRGGQEVEGQQDHAPTAAVSVVFLVSKKLRTL